MEHAELGVKILFESKMIRKFIEDDEYDNIIYKAIYNHNKLAIEDGLNDRTLMHCKIIRDADKLDNFRVKKEESMEAIFPGKYNKDTAIYELISDKVYDDFLNHKCIRIEDRKTIIDYWICVIGFIFDLNFNESLKYVKDNNYIDILVNRLEYKNKDTREKMEKIRICAKKYIESRINK